MSGKSCLLFSLSIIMSFIQIEMVVSQEVNPILLGDPFIMCYEDTYYAYGTQAENGIVVYTSDDLIEWSKMSRLALNKEDSFGEKWFWAPEVYFMNEKFYMYYSADEHICVAISTSPLGPFKQVEKKPMLEGEKSIDNTLFIDDDGTPYLLFDRFNDGLNIWIAELEEDLITLKTESMTPCIHVSQEWEKVWPRVNEGPFVIKHNANYYLIYSANSYESQFYGIGYATATNIMGEWTKYSGNPILQTPGDLYGTGHGAIFKDKFGNLKISYHAHQSEKSIHPRIMCIGDVSFEDKNGTFIMKISSDYLIPTERR